MEDDSGINFFFQAEDGIRDLVRSRGLGDVYKRQEYLAEGFSQFGLSDTCGAQEDETADRTALIAHTLSLIHI